MSFTDTVLLKLHVVREDGKANTCLELDAKDAELRQKPKDVIKGNENPRTTRVRKIVVDAAVELLIKEGHHAVTPQQVSRVTGVARSTIYRYWSDPVELLLDAIDNVVAPHQNFSTVGDLRTDLVSALESLRLRLTRRPFRVMFAGLLDHATRSKEFVTAQRRFVTGVANPLRDVVVEAISDGRLDPSLDPEFVVAQLVGPLLYQHVMLQAPITDELIAFSVNGFVDANELGVTPGSLRDPT